MVSKTDDIPASVPNCNPVDLADGAQDSKEPSKTGVKDSCGCGKTVFCLICVCCLKPQIHNTEYTCSIYVV